MKQAMQRIYLLIVTIVAFLTITNNPDDSSISSTTLRILSLLLLPHPTRLPQLRTKGLPRT